MKILNLKKVLFGLSVSLVLAMAIGSFAIGDNQTPANPQVETRGAVNAPASGAFTVTATDGETVLTDNDYSYASGALTIKSTTPMTIKNTDSTASTTDRIVIGSDSLAQGDTVNLTLAGVNIEATTGAALAITDNAAFNVNITLADDSENILKGQMGDYTNSGSAGIQKNGDTDVGMLTITGSTGENAGVLETTGGARAAGIGSNSNYPYKASNTSNITINGGYVKATGGDGAAGIGGGHMENGSYIYINDGTVEAYSGEEKGGCVGAGIGGGGASINAPNVGNGSHIYINGGKVTAKSNDENGDAGFGGAGIGGGGLNFEDKATSGNGSDIYINGGEVIATGSSYGAGIGGGEYGSGSNIYISGGAVTATGGAGAAGIGGGLVNSGTDVTISGGVVTATGGLMKLEVQGTVYNLPGAGIGGGASMGQGSGEASKNSISGNAVVFAASGGLNTYTGEMKEALQGFDSASQGSITGGVVFTGVGTKFDEDTGSATEIDWEEGTQYGNSVTITEDITFPTDFTVSSNAALTVGKNAEGKEATLSMAEGKKLTVEGSLINEGIIDIPAENLVCGEDNGEITTLLNYDPQGGEIVTTNDDEYITYQDASGTKKYENLPEAIKEGYDLEGWYTKEKGQGTKIESTDDVLLNQHILYANWVESEPPTPTPPTPTPPGPEPTPTPPGPEPQPTPPEPGPEPTPEPTPDPSVNPDGDGSGSGASSKTSDPFMGGMALALLGVATTGAVLVRKHK